MQKDDNKSKYDIFSFILGFVACFLAFIAFFLFSNFEIVPKLKLNRNLSQFEGKFFRKKYSRIDKYDFVKIHKNIIIIDVDNKTLTLDNYFVLNDTIYATKYFFASIKIHIPEKDKLLITGNVFAAYMVDEKLFPELDLIKKYEEFVKEKKNL